MKKRIVFSLLCAALILPGALRAEMTKEEAAEFLKKVVRQNVKKAGEEALEDNLKKLSPKGVAAFKKVTGIISNSELAASICWDLIQLGLQSNRAKFAKEFAMRLRRYLPTEYVETAELFGGASEKLLGWRLTNEADCTTILYELGKHTYDAITRMSGSEKQKAIQAGQSVEKFGALMMDIGGSAAWGWRRQFRR
ncbi:MAG: hypothetical protein IJS01_05610 [Lentisphaeria bacterium]|nr:hypothetical protein [Lentisphaeria bacterium]